MTNEETFRQTVQSALDVGLEPIVLANNLAVSRSTVIRWGKGSSIPHLSMRSPVFKVLTRLLLEKVRLAFKDPDIYTSTAPVEFGEERAHCVIFSDKKTPPVYRPTEIEALIATLEWAKELEDKP